MKRIFLLFISAMLCSFCFKRTNYFKLIEATEQSWAGGIQGSGRGVNYKIKLLITTDKAIIFDTLWMNNSRYKIEVVRRSFHGDLPTVTKDDTLLLQFRDFTPGERGGQKIIKRDTAITETIVKKESAASPPIKHKGKALFRFHIDGKEHYFILKEIKKLPSLNYP